MRPRRGIVAAAIAPLYWISGPLGILPLSFDGRRFVSSRRRRLYAVLMSVLFASVELCHLANIVSERAHKPMSGEGVLVVVSYVLGNTTCILNIFYVVKIRRRIIAILNRLDTVAAALHKVIQVKVLVWKVRVFVFFLQVLTTVIYFYLKLEEFRFGRGFSTRNAIRWAFIACRICGKTTTMCTGAHFCVLCLVIGGLQRALNRDLRLWFLNARADKSERKKLASWMNQLRVQHSELYFVAEEVVLIYGVYVLLNLVYVNIFFQTGAFGIISKVYRWLFLESVRWNHTLSYNLYWIFVDAIKASVFFYAAISVTKESEQMRRDLTQYANALPEGRHRAALFCLYVEATTMKIKVSACGLFVLDRELLFSSISSCTANLAILMQSYLADLQ